MSIFFVSSKEGIVVTDSLAAIEYLDQKRQVVVGSTLPEAYRIEGVVGKMSFLCSYPGGYPFLFPRGGGFSKTLGVVVPCRFLRKMI